MRQAFEWVHEQAAALEARVVAAEAKIARVLEMCDAKYEAQGRYGTLGVLRIRRALADTELQG